MRRRTPGLHPIGPVLIEIVDDIAHAMATISNSPKFERGHSMTEQELESLNTVVRYLWCDEQRHFEDMDAVGHDTVGHIFLHVETLDGYLLRQHDAGVQPSSH